MDGTTRAAPQRLGDFEIVREIGRGGMGVVYEAWQISLKRKVALKVLSGQLGLTSQAVVRFRREAEAAAKLHHTNIVPIYATGEQNGTYYYAMELIEGPSLSAVIRGLRRQQAGTVPPQRTSVDARPTTASSGAETLTGIISTLPPWVMDTLARPAGRSPPLGATSPSPPALPAAVASAPAQDGSTTLTAGVAYFDTIARLIAEVADGLDYAHRQGVIHRDIKPSNLLLNPVGSVSKGLTDAPGNVAAGAPTNVAAGAPAGRRRPETLPFSTADTEVGRYTSMRLSINDFGLARVLEQPGMTLTGDFLGTPRYMSPEQIAVGRAPLDHRTDIYSLGATLYELLTLQPPFLGERREQLIAQILHKDPPPPRRSNRKVPVDLETICMKALEKDPDRRYQTAGQMADDLRRYMNRFAIAAKRAGPLTRLRKWIRRRPAVAALLGAVVVLSTVAGLSTYFAHLSRVRMIDMERQQAIDEALLAAMSGELERAKGAVGRAESLGATAGWVRILRGQLALQQGHDRDAIEELEQAVHLLPDSVAAKAMLAAAYASANEWKQYYALLEAIAQGTPSTAEDYLFKGYAQSFETTTMQRGLESIDEAIRRRPAAPLACVLRAKVQGTVSFLTGSGADIERAVEDAIAARTLLPDNVLSLLAYGYACLQRAEWSARVKDNTHRNEWLAKAGEAADALRKFSDIAGAHYYRARYYEYAGQVDAALDEWRQYTNTGVDRPCYARLLYRCGAFGEALDLLQKAAPGTPHDHRYYLALAYTLAEMPAGYDRALALYPDAARSVPSGYGALYAQTILYLLGRPTEAAAAAQQVRPGLAQLPASLCTWYGQITDYQDGTISAAELLQAAGESQYNQIEAHFFIGLSLLSVGDRAGAARHFRAADRGGISFVDPEDWSRNFLARLEQDPTWPPWIPVREGDEAARQPGNEVKKTTQPASMPTEDEP